MKLVWRMTGTGPLTVTPIGPDGVRRSLAWGPNYHISSDDRPGQEWGTGIVFDTVGCWTIQLTRSTAQANVYIEVTA